MNALTNNGRHLVSVLMITCILLGSLFICYSVVPLVVAGSAECGVTPKSGLQFVRVRNAMTLDAKGNPTGKIVGQLNAGNSLPAEREGEWWKVGGGYILGTVVDSFGDCDPTPTRIVTSTLAPTPTPLVINFACPGPCEVSITVEELP